ncbi:MAG: MarR family transcriptional regulator [Gemmatimonadota bacterium]|nr:MarR family transcriptional regulator [Gemmatimonadota bacterium]
MTAPPATAASSASEAPKRKAPDAATATALKLFVVLARAQRAIHERTQASLEAHGLTGTEFAILEALYHKGPLLLGEVQRKILVSSGGITFLVDKLAERGLVERKLCPTDRRARYAALTRKGETLMAAVFPGHAEAICEAMSGLSRAEQKQATALLKQLGLSAASQGGKA